MPPICFVFGYVGLSTNICHCVLMCHIHDMMRALLQTKADRWNSFICTVWGENCSCRKWFFPLRTVSFVMNCIFGWELYLQMRIISSDENCIFRWELYLRMKIVSSDENCIFWLNFIFLWELYLKITTVFLVMNSIFRWELYLRMRTVCLDEQCICKWELHLNMRTASLDKRTVSLYEDCCFDEKRCLDTNNRSLDEHYIFR